MSVIPDGILQNVKIFLLMEHGFKNLTTGNLHFSETECVAAVTSGPRV